MEATATLTEDPHRYQVRALASGSLAVVDTQDRGRVALVGSDADVYEFLADYEAYQAEPSVEEEEAAYSRYLEDRAAAGTWFGRDYDDDPWGGRNRF